MTFRTQENFYTKTI
jgi:hypothetical protein